MSALRQDIEALRSMGLLRYLYSTFIYRHHMRFIHKRGGHQMHEIHPMGGPSFSRCDWCGHLEGFPERWEDLVPDDADILRHNP